MLDWLLLMGRANADGEFCLHARYWNARLRIVHGAERIRLDVVDGEIRRTGPWDPADFSADLTISAPDADWNALLEPLPRPFYHDLWAASVHHGFELSGERLHLCAYYPAVRRLVEIMREVRHDAV